MEEGDKPVDVLSIRGTKRPSLFYYSRPDFSVVRLKPLPKPNSFYEEGESWTLFHYSQLLC